MIRPAARAITILAVLELFLGVATGQPGAIVDRIVVRDKDKKDGSTRNLDGTLKFGAAGIQVIASDGKVQATVSPVDIVRVIPGDLPGVERSELLSLVTLEDKRTRADNEKARLAYKTLLGAKGATPKTKQYVTFKTNLLSTRILDESDDEEWSKQASVVAKEWDDYLNEYKAGWEIWPAARMDARLYVELSQYREVEKVWKPLTGKDYELPVDLKQEATLQLIDAYIREGPAAYPSASEAAVAAAKTAAGTAAKDKLAIYGRAAQVGGSPSPEALSAAIKEIEDKIAASKDSTVRGVGYGMIGELYLASKRPRDAMWAFLAVETLYNADKDEVFKALIRLLQVFKVQMDDEHEKLYREKIRRFRQQL
jgi:hypothetical protein